MESIQEIKLRLQSTPMEELAFVASSYEKDQRTGVQKLVKQALGRLEAYKKELGRLDQMMLYERKYRDYAVIAGIDEAGRGPLAGPVVAGAVILPKDHPILYLNDSKQVSEKKREELFIELQKEAVSFGVGIVDEKVIDEVNILQATYLAMKEAVSKLNPVPDLLLNDAVRIPGLPMHQVPIIHGDARSLSIAAGSIIAKVTRDHLMLEYDKLYPEYGFAKHKGYGSEAHIEALKKYGPCPIHRRTFIGHFVGDISE